MDIDVYKAAERVSNAISMLLSALLTIQLMGDLLGVNIIQLLRQAVTRPWVIPVEVIQQYYWLWYSMEWALLILMLADQVYTMRYSQLTGAPPPVSYARWMSLAVFMISFWLFIILRYTTFMMITIFSSISLAYTMFIRRE